MTEQRGDLGIIKDACGIMGPGASVVALASPTGSVAAGLPQTLRDWCGTPVAVMDAKATNARAELEGLAAASAKSGSTLWVIADDAPTIKGVLPSAHVVSTPTAVSPSFLERTLIRRPSHYVTTTFTLPMAQVPAG
jgi:hypothetical protein